jgi:hypothetical protein
LAFYGNSLSGAPGYVLSALYYTVPVCLITGSWYEPMTGRSLSLDAATVAFVAGCALLVHVLLTRNCETMPKSWPRNTLLGLWIALLLLYLLAFSAGAILPGASGLTRSLSLLVRKTFGASIFFGPLGAFFQWLCRVTSPVYNQLSPLLRSSTICALFFLPQFVLSSASPNAYAIVAVPPIVMGLQAWVLVASLVGALGRGAQDRPNGPAETRTAH